MRTLCFVIGAMVLAVLPSGESRAQNITNTLGATGVFTIKDASSTYYSLSQANGNATFFRNIELGNQSIAGATVGVMTRGGTRFMHNFSSTSNAGNTFVGLSSGNFTMGGVNNWDGSGNTGVGASCMASMSTGYANSALGAQSLSGNTTGMQNTAVGGQSLSGNSDGSWNTAVGYVSLVYNAGGVCNAALGAYGLYNNTGNFNTGVGYNAGNVVTSGSNLTLLGSNAEPSSATATNEVTLGDGNVTALRCNTQTISSLSDARDKKNIRDLPVGLDFLMKVTPRLFNWDRREWYAGRGVDGSKMQQTPTAGFIAQELDAVQTGEQAEWLKLVLKSNPERLESSAGNLLPVVVKAVQELKNEKDAEIAALKRENESLRGRFLVQQRELESLKELKARLAILEQAIARTPPVQEASLIEQR